MELKDYFFGEWVEYYDEEDKKEAEKYLWLWFKFFKRKIPEDHIYKGQQWVDRPNCYSSNLMKDELTRCTLGMKIHFIGPKREDEYYNGVKVYDLGMCETHSSERNRVGEEDARRPDNPQ